MTFPVFGVTLTLAVKHILLLALLLSPGISAATPSAKLAKLEKKLTAEQESFRKGLIPPEKHEAARASSSLELHKIWAESDHGSEDVIIRSRILILLGEGGGAAQELSRALTENPGDSALMLSLGQAQLSSQDYAGALASAQEVLKTDPTNQNALFLKNQARGRSSGLKTLSAPDSSESPAQAESRPSSVNRGFEFTLASPKRRAVVPVPSNERTDGKKDVAVDLKGLLPAYALMNYTPDEAADLQKAIIAASAATEKLHRENPNFIADATGNGALANMTQTLDMFAGGAIRGLGIKFGPVRRSCIDHQMVVGDAVRRALPSDSGLSAYFIRIGGQPWPEHHAVLVYPKDSNAVRGGVVLDPWGEQSAAPSDFVYPYSNWKWKYKVNVLGGEFTEEIKSANP